MSFFDDIKNGYASVAAPGLYHQQMLADKNRQLNLISAIVARQAPEIVAPLMQHSLNPTHAAMLETLKRAMMSPDPELQHEAYKMLSNNQDRTFSAINPTDLIKNFQAGGIDVSLPENKDLLLQAILKPQTQVNIGNSKPMPVDWAGKVYDSKTGRNIDINPTQSLDEAQQQYGGSLRFRNPEAKSKDLPKPSATQLGGFISNEASLAELKNTLKLLEQNPDAVGWIYKTGKLISPNNAEDINSAFDKHLFNLTPEKQDLHRRIRTAVSSVGALQRHDLSGASIPRAEMERLGHIPDFDMKPESVKADLQVQIDHLQGIQNAYKQVFNGKDFYDISKLAKNPDQTNLPVRTKEDGSVEILDVNGSNQWIPEPKDAKTLVKKAKDAQGRTWGLYDDGTEELLDGK